MAENIWDGLQNIQVDFTGHDFAKDIEKLLDGATEEEISDLATRLKDVRSRITKKEQVLATIIEVVKFLGTTGIQIAKVI